jgi:hypothetical protein
MFSIVPLSFLCFIWSVTCISNACHICINELNVDCSGEPEFHEFVELSTCDCAELQNPFLHSYFLVLIKEYEIQFNAPVIVFYTDLTEISKLWGTNSKYFVIGSPQDKSLSNMPFEHNAVMYRGKFLRTKLQVELGLISNARSFSFYDAIENGNKANMALVLLRNDKMSTSTANNMFSPLMLLSGYNNNGIIVTNAIELLLKENVVDLAVYSRRSPFNSCSFFKRLASFLGPSKEIKVATESDVENHVEVSVNRCPKADGTDDNDFFTFTEFKLGIPTPKQRNNCDGPHFVVEKHLDEILFHNSLQSTPLFQKLIIPQACSSSTNVEDYSNLSEEALVLFRDCEISKSKLLNSNHQMKPCSCDSSQIFEETDVDNSIINLQGRLAMQQKFGEELNEPVCKKFKSENDAPTFSTLIKPWEDSTHFQAKWISHITKYQGKYISKSLLSKERQIWLEYIINTKYPTQSTFRCRFCNSFTKKKQFDRKNRPLLSQDEGYFVPNLKRMWTQITDHTASSMHKNAVLQLKDEYEASLKQCSGAMYSKKQSLLGTQHLITVKMMRTVYAEVLLNLPFQSHADVVMLQTLNGLQLGSHHYERTSATRMVHSISLKMHETLVNYLKNFDGVFSILVDTATDITNSNYLFVFIRCLENNWPQHYFYRSLRVKSETSHALLTLIIDAFKEDDLYDSFRQKTIAFTSDSAPVMAGTKTGLATLLNETVDHDIYVIHCVAHKLELVVGHAFEKVYLKNDFEKFINSLHSFYYNKSFKRKESLMEMAHILGQVFYELNFIFPIRWVSSEFQALFRIYQNYRSIINNMKMISQSNDFTNDIKQVASKILQTLQNAKFFTTLLFAMDVLSIIKDSSLQFQKASLSAIGLESIRAKLIEDLQNLKFNNLKYLAHLLQHALCYKKSQWLTCSLQDFDTCNFKLNIQGEDISFTHLPTKGRYEKQKKWWTISKLRVDLIDALNTLLNSYFPEGSFAMFNVLLPKNLPHQLGDVSNYGMQIKHLANRFKMDGALVSNQFSNIIKQLISDSPEDYCLMKQNSDATTFWAHYLQSSFIKWEPEIKKLISISLTIPASTAELERSFSIFSHVMNKRRKSLLDTHIEDIMRLRTNGPSIDNFDPTSYVIYWLNSGHRFTDSHESQNTPKINTKRRSVLF